MIQQLTKYYAGDGLRAQLVKGVTGTAGLKVGAIVLSLATGVLLARALGPEHYGIYSFVYALIVLIGLPSRAGLPILVVRETARNQFDQRWGELRGLLTFANVFTFAYSVVAGLIAVYVAWKVWGEGGSQTFPTFLWALLLLPLISLGSIRGAVLKGLRKPIQGQLPEEILRPLILVLVLAGALLVGADISSVQAYYFHVFAALVAFLIGAGMLWKAIPGPVFSARATYQPRVWAVSLVPLAVFSALRMADSQITIVLLGSLANAEDVGLFKVAFQGAALVSFGLTAVNLVVAPHIARLYQAGDMAKLQEMITKSTRMVMLLSLPVFVVFVMWGEPLVVLVFGTEYGNAALALAVLSFGQLVNVSTGSVGVVLNMSGNERSTLIPVVLALVSNVAFCVWLIPQWGLMGAAIACGASTIICNLLLMVVTTRKTGLKTFFLQW